MKNFDALEWLWTHLKTEPIAPQEKGAKIFFLSKIGHSAFPLEMLLHQKIYTSAKV